MQCEAWPRAQHLIAVPGHLIFLGFFGKEGREKDFGSPGAVSGSCPRQGRRRVLALPTAPWPNVHAPSGLGERSQCSHHHHVTKALPRRCSWRGRLAWPTWHRWSIEESDRYLPQTIVHRIFYGRVPVTRPLLRVPCGIHIHGRCASRLGRSCRLARRVRWPNTRGCPTALFRPPPLTYDCRCRMLRSTADGVVNWVLYGADHEYSVHSSVLFFVSTLARERCQMPDTRARAGAGETGPYSARYLCLLVYSICGRS